MMTQDPNPAPTSDVALDGDWSGLSPEEQKKLLFLKQKRLLDTFLEHGALTQAQHDHSLTCLADKMGMAALPAEPLPVNAEKDSKEGK